MIRVALAALALVAAPLGARTVVVNANGLTLDDAGAVQRFATLVVGDDGRVEATLPAGVAPPAGTRVDAGGRTVMPGLIDAHGHVMELGYAALSVDLTGTASLAEALARVKAYAAAHPQARWIVGGGWNQEIWRLGRFPTAAELDTAVGDRPVYLSRVDGHAGWTNSAGIRAARVTAATPTPPAGGSSATRPARRRASSSTAQRTSSRATCRRRRRPRPTPR